MVTVAALPARLHTGLGFKQFVALIAALMAVNAIAIDAMLPALPAIAGALNIPEENQRQWIVTSYLLGFGSAQLIYGTLADRFGRRPVLLAGLAIYVTFSLIAAFSTSFEMMIAARVMQGVGSGAARVLSVSIVRDCYSGRPMARVMSLSFIVFLCVPIIAPSIGQGIVLLGSWRMIFLMFAGFGLAVMTWVWFRLPETMHVEDRTPISVANILRTFTTVLTTRVAIGYTMAMTILLGGLFGFISSAQQIFFDVFHAQKWFTTVFAMIALFMAASSLTNARLVGRYGTRRISHTALTAYVLFAILHAAVAVSGHETIVTFALFQSAVMFSFGLMMSNFGAMAMEPLGHLAGTAASVQGFLTTIGGAVFGFLIGQQFNGTAIPMTVGFAGFGIGGFIVVLFTERGRLFHPTPEGVASTAEFGH
jgi:DHA1 family bicyclomycin/chloramphenicol resistance-like MFS transporter